jgi:PAS domain S-box-containing protein
MHVIRQRVLTSMLTPMTKKSPETPQASVEMDPKVMATDNLSLRDAAASVEYLSSLLRSTVEAAGAGIFVTDLDGRILYSNDLILEIWGLTRDQLHSMSRTELLEWSADQVKHPKDYLEQGLLPIGESDDIEFLDGRVFERTVKARRAHGEVAGMVISARDVSDARRTTNLLAEAERIGGLGSWEADLTSGELYWSVNQFALYGVSPDSFDVSMEAFVALLHPDDRAVISDKLTDLGSLPNPLHLHFRTVLPDGSIRMIRSSVEMERDEAGHPTRLRGTDIDVTEWEATREALRRSENMAGEIVATALEGIVVTNSVGTILEFNPAAEKIFGHARASIVGTNIDRLVPPDKRERHRSGMAHVTEKGEHEILGKRVELSGLRADGTVFPAELEITQLGDANDPVYAAHVRDLTESRLAEAEQKRTHEGLRKSVLALQRSDDERRRLLDRMFAVQEEERHRIAGDIHDDSVQVMAAAALRLDILRTKIEDPEELAMIDRLRATVRTSIDRLRRLMFELRPPPLEREGFAAAVRALLGQVEEDSELTTELEDRMKHELPEQSRLVLYRVVQEAIINVRKHAKASRVRVLLREVDHMVVATVSDDGCGFEMGDAAESPAGHLGLSSMRERTMQVNGELHVRTAPGEGTIVEVRIPFPEESPQPLPLSA